MAWTAAGGLLVWGCSGVVAGGLCAEHPVMVSYYTAGARTWGEKRIGLLVAIQSYGVWFCVELCHAWRAYGGEAYRIMELAPKIGTERASSSVILYVMTHIFCHFWFWLLSVGLFLVAKPVPIGFGLAVLLVLITAFCILGLWFFMNGYKKGLAVRLARWLSHLPWLGKWVKRMVCEHGEQLEIVDKQIAALHNQNPVTFVLAVVVELAGRFLSCLEIMFVLLVLSPDVNYIDCVVILAFTSLFANLLFFIPLQLGGREGGFVMSAAGLAMTASSGIFVALIVRIREMLWIAIGLFLIKAERKRATALHGENSSLPTPNNDKK